MPGSNRVAFKHSRYAGAVSIFLVLFLILVSFPALSGTESEGNERDRLSGHALNATVWKGDGRASSFGQLARDAAERRYVLIGENHDNADHHRVQAKLIDALVAAGRKPSVVFEMIPTSLQATLDAYLAKTDSSAKGLGEAIGWEQRGWPAWETYQPIAEAAMQGGLPFLAGGLDRSRVMALGRTKIGEIDAAEKERLGLDREFPQPLLEDLLLELEVGHCNLVPKGALQPMVTVQRARDGSMARAMLDAGSEGAILIAGNGHVRNDRAVPYVLIQLAGDLEPSEILSVGLVGVEPDLTSFSDYLDGRDQFPFDYVVFTERVEPIDHCAKLRENFAKPASGDATQ